MRKTIILLGSLFLLFSLLGFCIDEDPCIRLDGINGCEVVDNTALAEEQFKEAKKDYEDSLR